MSFGLWNIQLLTYFRRGVIVYLSMSRNRGSASSAWIFPNRMATAFSQQSAAMLFQMPEEITPLHKLVPLRRSHAKRHLKSNESVLQDQQRDLKL